MLGGLKIIAGLDYEIRGTVPPDGALVASKHMSMLDAILLYTVLNDAVFVIKRSLLFVPVWGWFAYKMEMIAIDREARASALRKMAAAAARDASQGPRAHHLSRGHAQEARRCLPPTSPASPPSMDNSACLVCRWR